MKKKLLAVLLCVFMAMTLLPATALAVDDISNTGLDYNNSSPSVITTYRAGSGTVTWDPTVNPATLTFDNATIEATLPTGAAAVAVMDTNDGLNVVFKGTNSITALSEGFATALKFYGATTITLLPGSDTTLNAGNSSSFGPIGIFCNFVKFSDALTITGGGRLTVLAQGASGSMGYAIDASTRASFLLALNGGTLNFNGNVVGNVTLGGVTIPDGGSLVLHSSVSCTKGATGAVINGDLLLKDDTTLSSINELGLTGSGIVNSGMNDYIYVDDEWIPFTDTEFTNGLNLNSAPTVKTAYKNRLDSDGGMVVWDPVMTGGSVSGGTLSLNSLQMKIGNFGAISNFFTLPDVPVTVELNGTSTLSTAGDDPDLNYTSPNSTDFFSGSNSVELTGTGSINSTTSGYFINVNTGSVTLDGGTRTGRIKGGSVTLNNVTIPANGELNLKDVTGTVNATSTSNNGMLTLKDSASANDIRALNLSGNGYVASSNNYFTNNGSTASDSVAVNPATVSVQKGGTQTFNALVTGPTASAQTVTWSVEGNNSADTSIDEDGVLTVASDETALTLTVKATSTVNTDNSGTATVSVVTLYDIIAGENGQWTKGGTEGLGFTADGDYADFTGVSVDGSIISSDKYTSASGSTIVTLKPSYLNALSVGRHTLRIVFTDGYSETRFMLAGGAIPDTGNDSQTLLWLGIALLATSGLATSLILGRKKRQNG